MHTHDLVTDVRRPEPEPFLVFGHRGAAAAAVENTLPSLQRALDEGANGLEIDVCLTKDGHVVLWHDWEPNGAIALARQVGAELTVLARPATPNVGSVHRRAVDELTLDELRGHFGYVVDGKPAEVTIPTLEELLRWAVPREALRCVLFDLKLPAEKADLTKPLVTTITRALKDAGARFEHVFLTPHEDVYERASALVRGDALSFDVDPGIVLVDTMTEKDCSSHHALRRGEGHATTVAPKGIASQAWGALTKLVGWDVAAREKTRGMVPSRVVAATIDEPSRMRELVDLGVDGIVTDSPALLLEVLRARREESRERDDASGPRLVDTDARRVPVVGHARGAEDSRR